MMLLSTLHEPQIEATLHNVTVVGHEIQQNSSTAAKWSEEVVQR